ncbi:MAG: efflux RND transporter periplasmic adaptor subunit [Sulfurimonas sp.]|nr:efflux RND transporter periplasmic adaptor subunit [Sulfurimonas sp.]
MKKIFLGLFLTLTLVHSQTATVEQLFNIQTVKVKEASHSKSMKSFGFVKVDESRVYDVAPRFGGFVEILYADKLYKKVTKNQALAKVYSPEVLQAKDEYINSLAYSKNKGMIQSSMAKLKLLNIPNYEIKSIKKDRTFTTILSPASGYVFKKSINNDAAFNAKKVLFEIVNLDSVWVEINIHQNQLQTLQIYRHI